MPRLVDETGNRHGRLFVIKRFGSDKNNYATWLCQCDCGNKVVARGTRLRSGNTRSCGCLQKKHARRINLLPEGEASFNQMLYKMKRDAKKRGYGWQLTDEQVHHLTKQSCHYCGVRPLQSSNQEGLNGAYIYNGLDRVNNVEGYTIDNVVPCCGKCNLMKRTMTVEEFKSQIITIYKHFIEKGGKHDGVEGD